MNNKQRTIKYMIWNVFIIGTLYAGYLMDAKSISSFVIGALYAVIVSIYVIVSIVVGAESEEVIKFRKNIRKTLRFTPLLIIEPLFPVASYYMGYNKIAVAMFIEIILHFYILYTLHAKKYDDDKWKHL